jgi:sigma-B regulation protein RsbU (phosphoserine phosphatase)
MANEVQQGLLPHGPPDVPGLDVAAHSTYCDETGGDYFDFLPTAHRPPGVLTVACGDVTGHGVAAALLMASVRGVLRSNAPRCESLAELLAHLNQQMNADGGSRYMTLLLLEIDAAARRACWSCAGHDPPIVYEPATDSFSELEGGGLMLGVLPDSRYEQFARCLAPGQIVFIATDGVWEAANAAGERFGKGRLREAIRAGARAGGGAADVEAAVLASLRAFTGGVRARDDLTFVVLRLADGALPGGEAIA